MRIITAKDLLEEKRQLRMFHKHTEKVTPIYDVHIYDKNSLTLSCEEFKRRVVHNKSRFKVVSETTKSVVIQSLRV